MSPRTVLVTGANGYIGNAVARAFSRAGWITYGMTRQQNYSDILSAEEIHPIIISSYADINTILSYSPNRIDVIVSTTEQHPNYDDHFKEVDALLRAVASRSKDNGLKSLIIFTSGCKDYGITAVHGDPALVPHTEDSPLNPPGRLKARCDSALSLFDKSHSDIFDAVVTRPSTIYGLSSSFYAILFEVAAKTVQQGKKTLEIPANPKSIMHGIHIDDCAEAYVAIASAPREVVSRQVYNISGWKYETAEQVATALAALYGLDGVKYADASEDVGFKVMDDFSGDVLSAIVGYTQWVGSDKIRKDCGWNDKKPLFTEGLAQYRMAYEALRDVHAGVKKVRSIIESAST